MAELLDVDLTYALSRSLPGGGGLALDGLEALAARLDGLPAWARARSEAGRLGFLDLPTDPAPAEAIVAWCATAPQADDVVLAGIGGSALGARVFDALRPDPAAGPRLHVLDTVDPAPVERLLQGLDPKRTLLIGISKSGGTLETVATLLILEEWMTRAGVARERVVLICGEQPNPLRERAKARGYTTFPVPVNVGGRFSALTPVGLLPAALVGVDPLRLLAGAAAARARCLNTRLGQNPALTLAGLHLAAQEAGRCVTVLFPYGEALRPLAPWWAQLVGESLGKPGKDGPVGVTPVAASGPADQHSLLQLLMEGPDDKLTVFVEAQGPPGAVVPGDDPAFGAAAGKALGTILAAEREGTEYALAQAGRPSITIRLAAADPESVGAFLLTYEAAVAYWGQALGIDPFDQPGVELGKQAAKARLTGEPADLAQRLDAHRDRPRTRAQ